MSSGKRRIVVPSARQVAVKEIQLINRVEEMHVLREAADRAVEGQGGVVFLCGEAGIGKTRLARELGAYARSRGMQVLSGRCPALFRMDGVPPYVIWEQVIRDYLEVCTPEQLFRVIGNYPIEVSRLVPELKHKLRTIPQSFPLSPEHSRDRLFESVSQFITNISREQPLLVILDDLQWTDESSLLLMHYLALGIHKEPLLLLGAYRDTYVNEEHSLSSILSELNRERLLQTIVLKRLSFHDVLEMIKRVLEQDEVPRRFCRLVYEKTRGNPFFVEEVIKSLKEERVIIPGKEKWEIKEVSKIEFPETVKEVVKARIGRLDDESQKVLTRASFIGKDFTFEALCGVTGVEEDKLLEIMERMLKTGLIKEVTVQAEDMFSFADVIVRDVVYDEVSRLRRRRLHNLVGNALEKVYVEKIDEHFGELAYHFLEGDEKEKALDYFLKAGAEAQKVYAYDEAISYLEHALSLLEEKKDNIKERARIIETLGYLHGWSGDFDTSIEYFKRSLTLWVQLGNEKHVAGLHVTIASWLWQFLGDREKASQYHHMALEVLEKQPESVELAGLYEDISHMTWRTGESSDALQWAQKAYELAERLGDPGVLVASYNDLGTLSGKSGDRRKAVEYYEQGLKVALEENVTNFAIALYNNLSEFYGAEGEFEKSFDTAKKGTEFAERIGSLTGLTWLKSALARSHMFMGEVQNAISMFEDILELDKRLKYTPRIPFEMLSLGECYLWLGEWDKSLHYLTEARHGAKETGEYQASGLAAQLLGELSMEMEDYGEAEKYFNESSSIFEKAGDTDTQLAVVFPSFSRLYLKMGEIEKAEKLIAEVHNHAEKLQSRLESTKVDMLKAILFREQKKWEQSIKHFERSLEGLKSLNAQRWFVYPFADLLCEYGSTHLSRNMEGDREEAYSLLDEAFKIYQRMDALKRAEKTREKIVETGQTAVEPETFAIESTKVTSTERITTGYADLDDLLFGGIPRNYAIILTSHSCDEKDLLIRRFLETGAKSGEVTFYVTIDPGEVISLAEEFQSNFYLFICNPEANTMVRDLPNVFKLKGVENLTDVNIALSSAFQKLDKTSSGIRRACIEIISDVLLQHHAVSTRRWLTALIPKLRSKGFTTLALMDPGIHSSQDVRAIVGAFEGEINIYEKGSEAYLKIKKMYNHQYSDSELILEREKLRT